MASDAATSADTALNTFGEEVCDFTEIHVYGCSHCAGLPWGEDPEEA